MDLAADACYRAIATRDARFDGRLFVRPAEGHALRATIQFPRLSDLATIVARLRRVFDLAADPDVIGAHLSEDPTLAPAGGGEAGLASCGGVGRVRARDARRARAADHGDRGGGPRGEARRGLRQAAVRGGPDRLTHVFPGPEQLVVGDLSSLGITRRRGAALASLARAFAADPQITRSLEDAIRRLRALPGVGEWTAQYIAMREMREPDAFPAAGIGLIRAMADPNGRRPSPATLLALAERWRPWRAYAAQHLWTHGATR